MKRHSDAISNCRPEEANLILGTVRIRKPDISNRRDTLLSQDLDVLRVDAMIQNRLKTAAQKAFVPKRLLSIGQFKIASVTFSGGETADIVKEKSDAPR